MKKSTDEAREGVTGHNVRYVLLFGLAGVIVAFIIIYAVYFVRWRRSWEQRWRRVG